MRRRGGRRGARPAAALAARRGGAAEHGGAAPLLVAAAERRGGLAPAPRARAQDLPAGALSARMHAAPPPPPPPPRPPTQATYPSNTHTHTTRARMFICPTLPAADARALVGRCASQERLVSLIQAQVLALMSRDHLQELAHPTEAEAVQLVRAGLYLLLEIGQRVSMQQVHLAARRPPSPAARPHPPSTLTRRPPARVRASVRAAPGPHSRPAPHVAPRYWSARGAPTSSRAPATSSAAKCTPTCGRSCCPPRCCRTRSRVAPRRQLARTDALKRASPRVLYLFTAPRQRFHAAPGLP